MRNHTGMITKIEHLNCNIGTQARTRNFLNIYSTLMHGKPGLNNDWCSGMFSFLI